MSRAVIYPAFLVVFLLVLVGRVRQRLTFVSRDFARLNFLNFKNPCFAGFSADFEKRKVTMEIFSNMKAKHQFSVKQIVTRIFIKTDLKLVK
jgi:hypothetical protein